MITRIERGCFDPEEGSELVVVGRRDRDALEAYARTIGGELVTEGGRDYIRIRKRRHAVECCDTKD